MIIVLWCKIYIWVDGKQRKLSGKESTVKCTVGVVRKVCNGFRRIQDNISAKLDH